MNSVKVVQVDLQDFPDEAVKGLVEVYCSIWREPPWNEDFWIPERVVDDLKKAATRPKMRLYIAVLNSGSKEIVGFTWGYEVSKQDLQEIASTDALDFLFFDLKKVFYIDELGVVSSLREKGVGKELSTAIVREFQRSSSCGTNITLRTDIEAHAARSLYAKIGFRDLGIPDAKEVNRTYWLLESS